MDLPARLGDDGGYSLFMSIQCMRGAAGRALSNLAIFVMAI